MSYNPNNVFAKIIRGEIGANKVFEDDSVLAFHDISQSAPTHVLVIPKGNYINFSDFLEKAGSQEVAHFFKKVSEIVKLLGVDKTGFRLITNSGPDANQTVLHFHVHILAGKNLGELLTSNHTIPS